MSREEEEYESDEKSCELEVAQSDCLCECQRRPPGMSGALVAVQILYVGPIRSMQEILRNNTISVLGYEKS